MKELSKIALGVTASATLRVDNLYKKMKADGIDVVGFGAGEPDFNTPENICKAAHAAIDAGKTRYTAASGTPELKRAVCERMRLDLGVEYAENEIVVASGAKHSVYVALQSLVNPGDEVILPAPYWVTYEEAIRMAGGVPVIVRADEASDFKISAPQLEAAVTGRTKLFILNNPSNPTGMLYSEAELRSLMDVCVKHDLYVMSDEIYCGIVYDGKKFTSVAALGDDVKARAILVNGVSKSYAMTGWRIGYTASSPELAKVMGNYLSHSTNAPSTISQAAAVEALAGPQDTILAMRDEFERRRDYVVQRINAIDGLSCRTPDGAFYVMLNISEQIGRTLGGQLIGSSDDFSIALLEHAKVAAVSCTSFGVDNFLRLTYADSVENIGRGIDRLEMFVKG